MQQNLRLIMKRRSFYLFIIFILLFIFLVYRLVKINVIDGENYKTAVLAQQIQNQTDSNLEISAQRGTIFDRNGIALAESIRVYNVIFDPGLLSTQPVEIQEATARFLSDRLEDTSYEYLLQLIQERADSHYSIIARELSYDAVAEIDSAATDLRIKGVTLEEYFKRIYPYGTLASDIIGFLTRDGRGLYGLEEYYNDTLTGQTGRSFGSIDEGYIINQESVDAIDGNDITLNIDFTLQKFVEESMVNYMENKKEGDVSVAGEKVHILMMDPRDGKVLAMAEYPPYDLNDPYNITHIIEEEAFAILSQKEKQTARELVWKNDMITDNYEPGSTFKPVTYSIALEQNSVDPETADYYCSGSIVPYPGEKPISCWKEEGHGHQTLAQALENSCNVAFVQIGQAIGKDSFYKLQHMFGFGAVTGIDLSTEVSSREAIHSYENLGPVQLATEAFGQTFEVTPIQLITAFSATINGGYLYEPQVVKRINNGQGQLVEERTPEIIRKVISEQTSQATKEALAQVVEVGTGKTAQVEGYTIGGKTGTAEILPRGNHQFIVSFIGFSPVDNPEVVALVIVEKPKGVNFDNSAHAREVFVDVMEDALPYLGISKDYSDMIPDDTMSLD